VQAFPLDFSQPDQLTASLRGAAVLVNTYWIRFDRGANTQPKAVENTRTLVQAAARAGVKRIVHLSVTNPSAESPLPYYWGKAADEEAVRASGMSYGILRPTLVFGAEDILINNIAWLLRHFPIFAIPGDGAYRLQPVYVDDLAALAVDAVYREDNSTSDVAGPDILTFEDMVRLIGRAIGRNRLLVHVPPRVALSAAQFMSLFLGDVMLTPEEVDGLMTDLLVSSEPPRCPARLADWLAANRETVGIRYASELKRHYQPSQRNPD
jgi:NADH dehydrogenase